MDLAYAPLLSLCNLWFTLARTEGGNKITIRNYYRQCVWKQMGDGKDIGSLNRKRNRLLQRHSPPKTNEIHNLRLGFARAFFRIARWQAFFAENIVVPEQHWLGLSQETVFVCRGKWRGFGQNLTLSPMRYGNQSNASPHPRKVPCARQAPLPL